MKVKVNNEALAGVLGVKPGAIVDVKCKNGIPVTLEWRNRLKDAAVDECVTVQSDKKSSRGDK